MADKLANEAIQGNEIQKVKSNTFRIIINEKPVFKTKKYQRILRRNNKLPIHDQQVWTRNIQQH